MSELVLASSSPARRQLLAAAGIVPRLLDPAVDEDAVVTALKPAQRRDADIVTAALARAKAETGVRLLGADGTAGPDGRNGAASATGTYVVGCDSMLQIDDECLGKPGTADAATTRWRAMRGRTGVLCTGHHVIEAGTQRSVAEVVRTEVTFADVSDAEIEAYVATGEPLWVAGAFTLDSLGGAFIAGVHGDAHNVVGMSVATLRLMLAQFGVVWTDLWEHTD